MVKNTVSKTKTAHKVQSKIPVKSHVLRRPAVLKKHIWALVGLVVLVVAIFGVVGHNNVEMKYHKIRYGMDVRHGFNKELSTLSEPLSAFGITTSPKSTCIVEALYGYSSPQLACTATEQPYTVVGTSTVSKDHYVAEATLLDQLLATNGWTENHNAAPSYKNWMQAVTSGKDWYPDEGAYKNFGNEHCWMDAFLAYANPAQPAFTFHYGCDAPVLQKFSTLPF